MEDLSRKIGELLGDPQMMEQIKGLAGMLQQASPSHAEPPPSVSPVSTAPPESDMPDANLLGMVMKMAPLLRSFRDEDDSTRLLRSLKPFMHEERAKRIDGAIRLLHIMKLLPVLKSSGIELFNNS